MSLTQPEYIERGFSSDELDRYIVTGLLPEGAELVPGSFDTMRFVKTREPSAPQLLTEEERLDLAHKRFSNHE